MKLVLIKISVEFSVWKCLLIKLMFDSMGAGVGIVYECYLCLIEYLVKIKINVVL